MKVTIYTVPECQFSKAEKEYLQAHNVSFEEKNLETNKEFLTEMLALSNNFAGTPVTRFEMDDGQISIIKGYTKDDFDKVLGYSKPQETVVNSTINVPQKTPAPTTPPVTPAPQPTATVTTPPTISPTPTATPPVETPTNKPADDKLNSVLENLQSKADETSVATTPVNQPPAATPPAALPSIPDFQDK